MGGDVTWPGSDLIVEVDGYKHHRSRTAFAADRRKDRAALLGGRRTARYLYDEVATSPADVASEVRTLLAFRPVHLGTEQV